MSCLPEELIVELLSKLPAKSIFRFRCVSKQWLYLLSSCQSPRSVKNLHNKRHNRTPFLLAWNKAPYDVWSDKKSAKRLRLNDYTHYRMYVIDMFTKKLHHAFTLDKPLQYQYQNIFPCHGLVFLTRYNIHHSPSSVTIHVCNPSTGEAIELPKVTRKYYGWHMIGIGFGYLPSVNQYKVVRCFDDKYGKGFEIITLIDGGKADSYSWRSVNWSCGYLGLLYCHLCVNGVIYWLTRDQKRVLVFDLENEKYEIIAVPSSDCSHWRLMELRGSLCLAAISSERSINTIWRLNDKKLCSEWSPNDDICKWFTSLDSSFTADDGKKVLVSMSHCGPSFIINRKEVLEFGSWSDAFRRNGDDATYKLMGIPDLEFKLYPRVYFDSLFSLIGK